MDYEVRDAMMTSRTGGSACAALRRGVSAGFFLGLALTAGAVTKCIPGSVGPVRIPAARDGANLGNARFDRIELKRIAACAGQPRISQP